MPKKAKNDNPYKNLKEGAFTKQAKSHGMSVDAFSKYVIKNYKDKSSKYNPNITTYSNRIWTGSCVWVMLLREI